MSPTGWKAMRLENEIRLAYGKSLPESARMPGPVPVFGSNGRVGSHTARLVPGPGIVIGRKGSVGAIAYSESPFWPIDTTYYVENPNGHDWRFLYFLLLSLRLEELNSHSTIPGLNRESVYSINCSLPELTEQRTIAAILSKVQRAIEIEEKLIATTRELKQAAIRQFLTRGLRDDVQKETEIGPLPNSWEVLQLGSLAKIGNGSTPLKSNEAYWVGGTIPWLTSAKVYDVTISQADQFVTPTAIAECHLPLVKSGSVVVAITGQGKTLGHAAVTAIDTCVSQHLAYIQFNSQQANPHFVRLFLESKYEELRAVAHSGGSTKGALTCAFLKSFLVPLPQRIDQDEITSAVLLIERKAQVHDRKRYALKAVFEVLLRQLITGALDSSVVAAQLARTA